MSRELKRVPLDFDWPLNTVWKGYLSPYQSIRCKHCDGSGENQETKKLSDDWYDFAETGRKWCDKITQDEVQALVDKGRLRDFTHTWKEGEGWKRREDNYIPTAEEVNNWQSSRGMGHDAINRWICIETRAKRLGVWGHCKLCNGKGHYWCDDTFEKLSEDWKQIEPPVGEGFQLWENCSEGSPITPVFESLDALCEYAAENASTFANFKATKEQWREMLDKECVSHTVGNMVFI